MLSSLSRNLSIVCIVTYGLLLFLAANASRSAAPLLAIVAVVPFGLAVRAVGGGGGKSFAITALCLNALVASSAVVGAFTSVSSQQDSGLYRAFLWVALLLLPAIVNVAAIMPRVRSG